MPAAGEITQLLRAWRDGDATAREALFPLVYDELRRLAQYHFGRERCDHTLQPTAVVSELYLKLVGQKRVNWSDRREFFAISSHWIRRILVDHARKQKASKRGGGEPRIVFEEEMGGGPGQDLDLVALDDALSALATRDPRGSRVVELHVFTGLTFEEIAEILGVGRATVLRDWKHARLWLRREIEGGG